MVSMQAADRNSEESRSAILDKKAPTATVTEKSISDDETAHPAEWKPGVLPRFPWLGLGSLFMVLLCLVGSVVTLCVSDGRSQTFWPKDLPPSVIIQGLSSAEMHGALSNHGSHD